MRSLLLFVLSLALAACVGESEPKPFTLRPTTSEPDSLLARLDANELAEAFERLQEAGYTATMSIVESAPDGRETARIETTVSVLRDSVQLLSGEGMETSPIPFDPVARLLPKEPPFRNPAMREMYALARGPLDGPIARATAERQEGSDPIMKAEVAVDTTTGQVVSARVWRESRSAVFDEASEATIQMARHDGAWWPVSGHLITDIDVPLSESPQRQLAWRVLSIGGVELAADSSATD